MWTDTEVELLLRVTLDYKTTKVQENVDWDSCKCKYSDIGVAFHTQYPRTPTDKDFPNNANAITKVQLTPKIKEHSQQVQAGGGHWASEWPRTCCALVFRAVLKGLGWLACSAHH